MTHEATRSMAEVIEIDTDPPRWGGLSNVFRPHAAISAHDAPSSLTMTTCNIRYRNSSKTAHDLFQNVLGFKRGEGTKKVSLTRLEPYDSQSSAAGYRDESPGVSVEERKRMRCWRGKGEKNTKFVNTTAERTLITGDVRERKLKTGQNRWVPVSCLEYKH